MRDKREFDGILRSIRGGEPAEYDKLVGDFDFTRFVLHSLRIGATAESTDTLFVLHVPQLIAGFPAELHKTPIRRTALEDLLARKVAAAIDARAGHMGDARSRLVFIARPGPQILPRSSIVVAQDFVEARIIVRLPLRDGCVHSDEARCIFFEDIPTIVNDALIYCNLDEEEVDRFIRTMEDADQIRQSLLKRGLVSFASRGAKLCADGAGLTLDVADEDAVALDLPHAGTVRGVGIPAGITVIVGDPYSGRSELIRAMAYGIYNHAPGAGREMVVSVPDAVEVLARKGRSVRRVDVSPFLGPRPGRDVKEFTTDSATAAESQMASVVEAVQAGAQVLLLDEASSDPAFLAADIRLSLSDPAAPQPVIPLAARARQIADEWRVSLVIGACACAEEFVPAADTVLLIENGRVRNMTKKAKEMFGSAESVSGRLPALPSLSERKRWVVPSSIDPSCGREDAVIEALGIRRLRFGRHVIDLSDVPQVVDESQTMTIGLLLYYAKLHYLDEGRTFVEMLDQIDQDLSSEGLDALSREMRGDLARPRRFEVAAALNRLESLRIAAASRAGS